MKVLGISLEASTAVFSAIENQNGQISEIGTYTRKIELKDHLDSAEVKQLQTALHSFLDSMNFDRIGIIKRGTKGRFAASPITFKIEGLIQLYQNKEIEFISQASIRAFYKKNTNPVNPKYSYQKVANGFAYYLLENK